MIDATAEFFDALVERGHEPLLENATGTVRFDLKDGKKMDRWLGVRRQAPAAGRQLPPGVQPPHPHRGGDGHLSGRGGRASALIPVPMVISRD
jgi:hypothetical protein